MTLVLKVLIELVGSLTILIAPNPTVQPAHLEEAQLIKRLQIIEPLSNVRITCSSSTTMASNSRFRRNAQQALARLNQPEEAMVKTTATPNTASAPSQVPTSAPASALYTQENLQRITKLYMDLILQRNCQEGPRQGLLKARFPDLYYEKLHMESYHFC